MKFDAHVGFGLAQFLELAAERVDHRLPIVGSGELGRQPVDLRPRAPDLFQMPCGFRLSLFYPVCSSGVGVAQFVQLVESRASRSFVQR